MTDKPSIEELHRIVDYIWPGLEHWKPLTDAIKELASLRAENEALKEDMKEALACNRTLSDDQRTLLADLTAERVKDATDLAALVGQVVKLRKQGAAFVGLCPFHSERSPSFQVVPARGFYHCFGCGKHGDAFAWLMEREGLSFPEALEHLARAAGIEVPKEG